MTKTLLALFLLTALLSANSSQHEGLPPTLYPTSTQVQGQVPDWKHLSTGFYAVLINSYRLDRNRNLIYEIPAYSAPVDADGLFTVPLDTPAADELSFFTHCPKAGLNAIVRGSVAITTTPTPTRPEHILLGGFYGVREDDGTIHQAMWLYADRDIRTQGRCTNSTFDLDVQRGWNLVVLTTTRPNLQSTIASRPAPAGAVWFR